jgi:hypothetical protein
LLPIFLRGRGTAKADSQYLQDHLATILTAPLQKYHPSRVSMKPVVSVPEALIAFLDSNSFEDAVKKRYPCADADTQLYRRRIAQAFINIFPNYSPGNRKILAPDY